MPTTPPTPQARAAKSRSTSLLRARYLLGVALAVGTGPISGQTSDPPSLDAFGLLVATQSRPSFTILGAGARAAGMGGAFTALADDASAASFNPAGLALLLTPEASLAIDWRDRADDYAGFEVVEVGGPEAYSASASNFSLWSVNFASFTLPTTLAGRNLTLQISYHRPIDFGFDSQRSFTESTPGGSSGNDLALAQLTQDVEQQGDLESFSLAAAYQLTERLSLGLVASRWQGDWAFSSTTAKTPVAGDGDGATRSLRFTQRNQLSGWSLGGGFLLRYRWVNVGASGRAGWTGDFAVSSTLASDFPTPFPASSSDRGELDWASSWTVGLAFKPLQTWFLTIDYVENDWDDMILSGFGEPGSEPISFFDLQPVSTSTTTNTASWRFGSEVTLVRAERVIGLRAGAFFEPRPQLLAPSDEKTALRGLSLGVGMSFGQVTVDLAVQRTTSRARILELVDPQTVAEGVVEAQAEGDIASVEHRVYLSALYQFRSPDSLRKLFHFLFVGPLERPAPPSPPSAPTPPAADDPADDT